MTYIEVQAIIDRVRWLGGSVNFCYPESMPQAVCLIDWGLPLRIIKKTGVMPDILIQASDEFFKAIEEELKEENSQAA